MPFSICMFCKRSLDEFCYSIFDSEHQPYLNIVQLFGAVEEQLEKHRCICYECIYIIRWIYFMKKILSEAIFESDITDNDRVIAAFNIFKLKINQPLFYSDDDTGTSDQDAVDSEVSHSNILWSDTENEHEPTPIPVDLSQQPSEEKLVHDDVGVPPSDIHMQEQTISMEKNGHDEKEKPKSQGNSKPRQMKRMRCQSAFGYGETGWYPARKTRSVSRMEEEVPTEQKSSIESIKPSICNDRLMHFNCAIKICETRRDTLDEMVHHHKVHHNIEMDNSALHEYQQQLNEFNTCNLGATTKFKYRCMSRTCNHNFSTIEALTDHKISDHNLLAKFWCAECYNLPFTSQIDLNHHMFQAHNNIEMNCIHCAQSFKNVRNYQSHMEEHWTSLRLRKSNQLNAANYNEYSCLYCDKIFLHESQLKTHSMEHDKQSHKAKIENRRSSISTCIIRKRTITKSKNSETPKEATTSCDAVCAFKTRLQKDIVVEKRISNFALYLNGLTNNKTVGKSKVPENTGKKTPLSLPPRKRRAYKEIEVIPAPDPLLAEAEINGNQILGILNLEVPEVAPKLVEALPEVLEAPQLEQTSPVKEKSSLEPLVMPVLLPVSEAPATITENAAPEMSVIEESPHKERITMKISLKAIERYKKEEKRNRSKRKGHKSKKKHKGTNLNANSKEVLAQTAEIENVDQAKTKSAKQLNGITSQTSPVKNKKRPSTQSNTSEEGIATIGGNDMTIDQINMIILGDQINDLACIASEQSNKCTLKLNHCNSIDTNVENIENHTKRKIENVDGEQLVVKERHHRERRVKRKPDKIQKLTLNDDGSVKDKRRIDKRTSSAHHQKDETVDEVPNAWADRENARLKDHLYAKSAFSDLQSVAGTEEKPPE